MGSLAVFCTNAINIYAGVNGLEAGQALVIAVAALAANLIELAGGQGLSSPHLFSATLLLPFMGTTIGLLVYNWCVRGEVVVRGTNSDIACCWTV